MRLLFFTHSLTGGGAERVTAGLANHWAERGWDITLVTVSSRPDAYALHPAVRRVVLDMETEGGNPAAGIWNNVRRVRALRAALKEHKPEIAMGVMWTANMLLAVAAAGLDVATIGTEHTYPPRLDRRSPRGRFRPWSYGRLHAVVALTADTRAWLEANTRARRVEVIPNGIVWPLPVHPPHLAPASIVPADVRVLLAVGRLDRVKGFDILIDVFARLTSRHPHWSLVILGEGSERASLEEQIAALGLQRRVLLPGRAGNVGDWYSRAGLFVLSSRFEGFPNAPVEALASGVPVVSFDCNTGPRDIVRHEVDGLLVPDGDAAALTSALDRVMSDDTLRRSLAARAAEARERFSIDRITKMWESLFEEVRSERR